MMSVDIIPQLLSKYYIRVLAVQKEDQILEPMDDLKFGVCMIRM